MEISGSIHSHNVMGSQRSMFPKTSVVTVVAVFVGDLTGPFT